jgi:hypothetical protein
MSHYGLQTGTLNQWSAVHFSLTSQLFSDTAYSTGTVEECQCLTRCDVISRTFRRFGETYRVIQILLLGIYILSCHACIKSRLLTSNAGHYYSPLILTPNSKIIFICVRKVVETDYSLHPVCSSVRPHETNRLPLDRFSRNFMFGYYSKVCREKSNFMKIR